MWKEARSAAVTERHLIVITRHLYYEGTCSLSARVWFQVVLFNLVFFPLLSLYPQYQAQDVLD